MDIVSQTPNNLVVFFPPVRELSFTAVQEATMITIEYVCSTVYHTPLNIMVIVGAGNETLRPHSIVCLTGRILVNSSLTDQCDQTVNVSGYWIFTDINNTTTICSLSNYSVSVTCPTVSPTNAPINPGM